MMISVSRSKERTIFMTALFVTALCGLCAAILSACAVPAAAPIDAPEKVDLARAAILEPGDKVKLTVFGEDDINGEYLLDQRGVITLPMLGEVKAAGQTQIQLQNHVSEEYVKRGFLSRPQVSVDVASLRSVYILGEVAKPGAYPYEPALTGLKIIAIAGGYTPRAAEGKLLIDRIDPKTGAIVRMNGEDTTPIRPGDTLVVRERIF